MGGGDLNTKKSWHPNTMKNQERVWKAEQAAAEEKKRILELQRERDEERDRTHLKDMAQRNFGGLSSGASDNRLHWMYDKPDKQVHQEDYLLGKAIGKNEDAEQAQFGIPALSRRVVGSSMTTTVDDTQVDLARKLREDPLLLVKERERAARAALLNNPLQRKKLTELLRKEQDQKVQMSKSKKKSKKKEKDLDHALAEKLNALAGKKEINLTSLLNSDDSSDFSEDNKKLKKKKKKEKHKKKKSKKDRQSPDSDIDTESSDDGTSKNKSLSKSNKDKISKKSGKDNQESRKRHSDNADDNDERYTRKKTKHDSKRYQNHDSESFTKNKESMEEHNQFRTDDDRRDRNAVRDKQVYMNDKKDRNIRAQSPRLRQRDVSPRSSPRRDTHRREYSPKRKHEDRRNKKPGLSEEEKAARLAEMVAAGAEREVERGERVARQRAEDNEAASRAPRHSRHEARALPDSLESRIRSNRHYIQRDRLHMNEHFARR